MTIRLPIDPAVLGVYCRRHHIRRLSLFGSELHGTATASSDIDLLVEFEPGRVPGLMALSHMERELSVLLDGRKIDLRTAADLSRHFRDQVLRTAAMQYSAERQRAYVATVARP